eukprot:9229346-Lingulodinium_polyedra.AAC.1
MVPLLAPVALARSAVLGSWRRTNEVLEGLVTVDDFHVCRGLHVSGRRVALGPIVSAPRPAGCAHFGRGLDRRGAVAAVL